ncbi:hypothetical protein [Streptomyces luteireticuli]|uniref:hypothetical protein n=1 Tax=Streptomyces luteireticuli TaxID=173858 RepID=UPI003557D3B5
MDSPDATPPAVRLIDDAQSALKAFGAAPRSTGPAAALAHSLARLAVHASTDGTESDAGAWNAAYWALLAALGSVNAVRNTYPPTAQQAADAVRAAGEAVDTFAAVAQPGSAAH